MKFRFIIRGRNCGKYIRKCLYSVADQTNENWTTHVILDAPDSIISDRIERVTVNPVRMGLAHNIYVWPKIECTYSDTDPEDVFVFLDADDWLDRHALEIVAKAYQDKNCLITHGSYIKVSKARKTRISQPYPKDCDVRKHPWRASHLKTVKAKLFRHLPEHCMKDDNGNWLEAASDVAMMIPLIEMAGLDRVRFIPEEIYYWRDSTPFKTKKELQKKCEHIVRKKPPLARLNKI
jgi:glycosyltransferase involved in cell wall biosynthesis